MMSMHRVPSWYTLGWNISEVNLMRGGLSGYRSVKVTLREKIPPSNGVSSGPKTLAFHTNKLSSVTGLALHPSGGLFLMAFKSDMRRSMEALVCG